MLKKLLSFFFLYFFINILSSQNTLYWIGGSGKWNDHNHWSLQSGGQESSIIPDKNTNVIFDENSQVGAAVIEIVGDYSVKSINIKSNRKLVFKFGEFSNLNFYGDIFLTPFVEYLCKTKININGEGSVVKVNTGGVELGKEVVLKNGNFEIQYIKSQKITFESGNFLLQKGFVEADLLDVQSSASTNFINANIKVKKISTPNNYQFASQNSKIISKTNLDASSFTTGSTYKVYNPDQISSCAVSLSSKSVACAGKCTGEIYLTFSPTGTCVAPSYTLDWSTSPCTPSPSLTTIPGAGTYTIGGICACGSPYVVGIYDNLGNLVGSYNSTTVYGPTNINFFNIIPTPPACFGQSNGSISAITNGGNPSTGLTYTVTVDGSTTYTNVPQGTSFTYTNLAAGTHTFVVTDASGCTFPKTATLSQPPQLFPNGSYTNVACNGTCSGAVQLSPTGGTPPYTYTWSVAGQTANIVSGICAPAVVTGTVIDSHTCTAVYTTTITQPTSITVVPSQTNVTCYGAYTGAASVSVSGGVPPYSYSWTCSSSTTNSATGLAAGNCTTTITDNNNCTKTQTFNITQPASITIVPSTTSVSCNGGSDGKVTFTISGGTPNFNYTLSPIGTTGTTSSTATINGLSTNTYTISVKDANGCTQTKTFSIVQPPALTATVSVTNVLCNGGNTGSATVTASGGVPPYTYTWSVGSQTTTSIGSLTAGTNYSVIVKDVNSCTIAVNFTITQPSAIVPNITTGSVSCNGAPTGTIAASPSGGTPGYNYTLTAPGGSVVSTSSPPYTGLTAGNYTLTIQDANGCVITPTVNLNQPNALTLTATSTSVSCFGKCDGSLASSAGGGTPPYTYVWTDGTGSYTATTLNNQCAGTWTLTVYDGHNCTATKTVNIATPPDITITATTNSPSCSYTCNASITTTVIGGSPGYSYNWSTGAITSSITGLCAGSYTLIVTDSKNCPKPYVATINAPPALTININTTSISCFSYCNGSATATATGGTPGYFYQWNTIPVTNNSVVTGLCPNNYIVTVTDLHGCVTSSNVPISQPAQLQANITGIQASCSSTCIGAATVTPSGGTPAYSYTWLPSGGSSSVATGLCIGNYTVQMTDINGCPATATVHIPQSIFLTLTTSGNTLTCNGSCNGAANVNVLGGLTPYTYTWTSPSGTISNSAFVNGLCAGGYTIGVTDAQGCSNIDSVRFANPSAIVITASNVVNAKCNSACNGSITVSASGGTGALTYSWTPSVTGQGTGTVTNLCSGTYTVNIKDANNCTIPQTFTITEPPATTINIITTDPTNCTTANGAITATISGGIPNYNYTVTTGPIGSTSSTFSASGLLAGAYTITTSDANGCVTSSITTLNAPNGPTLIVNTTSIVCYGGSTGSATVNATTSNPPINPTYTWMPSVSTSSIASSLSAGVYVVQVKDAGNCVGSKTLAIIQPTQFTLNPNVSQPSCNTGCTGSINVAPSGGTPVYSYSWNTGATTPSITSLCAGNYTLDVTDANNCVNTQTFIIIPPSTLNVTYTVTNVKCNGACNGSISISASGGTPPYSYSWTPVGTFPGSTLGNIASLCPNVYTLQVKDNVNCSTTITVTVTEPAILSSTLNVSGNVTCNGFCDGTGTVVASGGTLPYNYSWSGTGITTNTINTLCAGTYSSIVTDANGCPSTHTFIITQPNPVSVTLTPSNPLCYNQCNGSINANVIGGNGSYSYTWIPTGGSAATASSLCSGNYTLLVSDIKGCPGQQVTSLTNPPKVLANLTFTNPTNCSTCNGIIQSNPLNATAPINYTWSCSSSTTNIATGLCAGTCTVYLKDNKGCLDSGIINLISPNSLTLNPSVSPSDCFAVPCNGSITVGASGGTAPYTYTWIPPSGPSFTTTAATQASLCSGVYTVIIQDASACKTTTFIPLSNSNGPSGIAITYSNITCKGYCNGVAIASPPITGGTAPYTYTWVAPPIPSATITNLCPGVYSVQVTDVNNCKYYQSVTITEPSAITDNPNISIPLCNGVCNGSVGVSPSGGTGSYTYSWSTGVTSNSITSLCPGNYSLTITDANGCQMPFSYNLVGGITITASTFAVNNNCYNQCNGSASIVGMAGGTPPYSFNWSDPLGQTNSTATGLCSGNYYAIVKDNNGCFDTLKVSITAPSSITATSSLANPSCGLCNGSSTLNISGGTPSYTVNWSNGNIGLTGSNLCAGLYMVTVTDALGCKQNINIPISNSSSLLGSVSVSNPPCGGTCNGSATITAGGGTTPYTYNWIGTGNTTNNISGLCAGLYYVQVKDAAGCIVTDSVKVSPLSNMTLTPHIIQPSCGLNNGSITVSVNGGTAPYTYTWSPLISSTATLSGIPAGSYTLQVGSGSGCVTTSVFVVSNSNAPVINLSSTDATCFGLCDGTSTVTVVGGVSPFTINWSTGASASGTINSVSGLCSGVITVSVTDNAGCVSILSNNIQAPSAILNSFPIIQTLKCYNDNNASINVVSSGGTLVYTYSWTPVSSTSNPLNNLSAGNYTVTVTDANSCVQTVTANIPSPLPINIATGLIDASCNTATDAAISTTVSGGTPSYTYSWVGPNSYTNNVSSITNIGIGTYSLDVIDANGCKKDTTIIISTSLTVIAAANSGTVECGAFSYTLNGSASINANSYEWYAIPSGTPFTTNVSTAVSVPVGTYSYVLTAINGGCKDTAMVVLIAHALPNADAGPFVTMVTGSTTAIGGSPTGPAGSTYTWMPSSDLNNGNVSNPIAGNLQTTTYTVYITDTNGCTNYDTVTVFVFPEIVIPNGFSPNSDGKNDVWQLDNIQQFPDCIVEVYSRWGELLFTSKGYKTPWDGRYKGQEVPVGTYYYVINLNTTLFPKPYTGPLTIFR